MKRFLTSEAVSMGHPDKLADQISDAVLDNFLIQDPDSKVACEAFLTDGLVIVGGEAYSEAYVDVQEVARGVIKNAGYSPKFCFDPDNCGVISTIHSQSKDIRDAVVKADAVCAGDQGMMFGYAVNETPDYMPLAIKLANETMRVYDKVRRDEKSYLQRFGPDAKCQYTIRYVDGKAEGIEKIIVSMQHEEGVHLGVAKGLVEHYLLKDVFEENPELAKYFAEGKTNIIVNPSGRFVIGGPKGDTGLTGRKIIVDTYGGRCPHGGGAFSGKDCTKVDRSGAYVARYIAKNIVAAGLCDECLVQLSYCIGLPHPTSIDIHTDKGDEFDAKLMAFVINNMLESFSLGNIIDKFNLKKPIFYPTSAYGHFGRKVVETQDMVLFPWEKLDLTDAFKDFKA